jgi:hypothetical protein
MWDAVVNAPAAEVIGADSAGMPYDGLLLDEVRLDEAAFDALRQRAQLRYLARNWGGQQRPVIDSSARHAAERRLRSRFGLATGEALRQWCRENNLDPEAFERLLEDEARLDDISNRIATQMDHDLLDLLRLDGDYARLAARARHKRAVLAERGLEDAAPATLGLTPIALVAWHFEERLGRSIPEDLDSHVRRLGFRGRPDFYRALAREWLYSQSGRVEAGR